MILLEVYSLTYWVLGGKVIEIEVIDICNDDEKIYYTEPKIINKIMKEIEQDCETGGIEE